MSYNSGQTSVTGSVQATGSCPVVGTSQTFVNVNGAGNGTTQTAYTVTTGKTFYLYGFQESVGYIGVVYKNDGTTVVVTHQQSGTAQMPFASSVPIAVYTSAQLVKVNASNSSTYWLWGVEQ